MSTLQAQDRKTAAGDGERELPVLVIDASQPGKLLNVAEFWRFRELWYFLTWRDLKVRYKQTALGVAWAVLQPVAIMAVFSLFFYRLADLRSGGIPYPLYVLSGIVPWLFFANAINAACQSLIGNQDLVTKVFFPRLLMPLSSITAMLVDFAITYVLLLIVLAAVPAGGIHLTWKLLLVPFMVLVLVLTALGVGALLAALSVAYRDFRHTVPFLVQLWMFATPTIYLRELPALNPRWGAVLPFNPVDGLITNLRIATLGLEFDRPALYALGVSTAVGMGLFVLGCWYFRRVERRFADII